MDAVLVATVAVLAPQSLTAADALGIPVLPEAKKASLQFTLKEAQGVEGIDRAISGGIPFARGVLKDPQRVRLVTASGKTIPLQTRITGYWPEGTVKWLLLDFIAGANEKTTYTLEYGAQIKPYVGTALAKADAATKTKAIQIDTGPLQLEFDAAVSGGIRSVRRGKQLMLGDTNTDAGAGTAGLKQSLEFIHTKDPGLYPRPELIINNTATPPKIDGKLDDAVWKQVKEVTELVDNYTNQLPAKGTTFQMAYDDKNLYIAFSCEKTEKDLGKIAKAQAAAEKKGVWSQPVFEVFVDIDGDETDFNQLFFNAAGVSGGVYMVSIGRNKRDLDVTFDYKVSIEGKRWIGEACIPLASLTKGDSIELKSGHRLGLLFGREIMAGSESTSYSWVPTYGQWHLPTRFGKVFLEEKPASVVEADKKYNEWDSSGEAIDMEPLLASSLNKKYQLKIASSKTAIKLDGNIDAKEWAGAETLILRRSDQQTPTRKTEVSVKTDDAHMYVAFKCFDTKRELQNIDKNWWDIYGDKTGDGVRLHIDANHDGRDIQAIAINSLGKWYHTFERNVDLPFKCEVAAGTFDGGWCIEIAVPFKELAQYESLSKNMGVNFMRWSTDTHEEQMWSPCDDFPDDAKTFGVMQLEAVKGVSPVSQAFQRTPEFVVKEMILEENGPVKAVVCMRGEFNDANYVKFPVTMRVYSYKGLSTIRVVHNFIYGGKPWEDFVTRLGLGLNLSQDLGDLTATTDLGAKPKDKDSATLWDLSSAKGGVSVAMQWSRRLEPK
ncbi:MAG: hypothetical protein HRU15_06785, partial [Planctomycetes bacterium]|nr:hypothetical protein [Planctomycetota bacterium]